LSVTADGRFRDRRVVESPAVPAFITQYLKQSKNALFPDLNDRVSAFGEIG
jgi:hypothetical protein